MQPTALSEGAPADPVRRDAFMQRMFGSLITSMETQAAYLGLKLGLYEALAKGPLRAADLAASVDMDARYAREWLEQQAVAGFLDVEGDTDDAEERRYVLPAAHAEVLLDGDSTNFLGFVPLMTAAMGGQLGALTAAFRSGEGVAWEAYGADLRVAQGNQNRAFLRRFFVPEVLPAIEGLDARLKNGSVRVADLACGVGWASIAIAEAYPRVQVDGLDLDGAAIEEGTSLVKERGLAKRVHLEARDASDARLRGKYGLVVMVEALHDLAHPVRVLQAARELLEPGGIMVVVDENTEERFVAPGRDTERAFYGFSVLACLANGRTEAGSAMTGTAIRPDTVRRYAADAGFASTEVLPVPHDFFRFYLLRPDQISSASHASRKPATSASGGR